MEYKAWKQIQRSRNKLSGRDGLVEVCKAAEGGEEGLGWRLTKVDICA